MSLNLFLESWQHPHLAIKNSALDGSPSPSGAGAAVLEREEEQVKDPGDADRYAHLVRKDKLLRSNINGTPVIALCGKVWVPRRDGSKYPICPACKEIRDKMERSESEGGYGWPLGAGGF